MTVAKLSAAVVLILAEHKIDSTEKEVDFWRAEAHEARKEVTE